MSSRIHNFRTTEKLQNITTNNDKAVQPAKEVKVEKQLESVPVKRTTSKSKVNTEKVMKEINEAKEALDDFSKELDKEDK